MSMADELEKLYRLLQSGALTQSEYDAAKARLLAGPASNPWLAVNRVRRAEDDKWIAGVCGGVAKVTGVEAWIWRLIFVLGMLAGGFTGVLYIILWILVPREGQ